MYLFFTWLRILREGGRMTTQVPPTSAPAPEHLLLPSWGASLLLWGPIWAFSTRFLCLTLKDTQTMFAEQDTKLTGAQIVNLICIRSSGPSHYAMWKLKERSSRKEKKSLYRILDIGEMVQNQETHIDVTSEASNTIISNGIMWSCFFIPVIWLHINQFWLDSKLTEHAPQWAVKFCLIT